MSRVRLIWECPRCSWMILGCTPSASSKVAAVCRRSLKRMLGSFAFFSNGLKDLLIKLLFQIGPPLVLQNTHGPGCPSASICVRCSRRAATAKSGSLIDRRLLADLGSDRDSTSLASSKLYCTESACSLSRISDRSSVDTGCGVAYPGINYQLDPTPGSYAGPDAT